MGLVLGYLNRDSLLVEIAQILALKPESEVRTGTQDDLCKLRQLTFEATIALTPAAHELLSKIINTVRKEASLEWFLEELKKKKEADEQLDKVPVV